MSFFHPFPWSLYSKKLILKIENPKNVGHFTEKEAKERGMRFATGISGELLDGNIVQLFWLVDPEDGVIVDARFQTFGQSALVGAAEIATSLVIGKNYDQASRISAKLIDQEARDDQEIPAFPKEVAPHITLVLEAIKKASDSCTDIPLSKSYIAPPTAGHLSEGEGLAAWETLSLKEKISAIEQVLDQEVRPYIALDEGGVEVINLVHGKEVVISYQGSCTTCYSSTGATLAYIQQVLRARLSPLLEVIPDFDASS